MYETFQIMGNWPYQLVIAGFLNWLATVARTHGAQQKSNVRLGRRSRKETLLIWGCWNVKVQRQRGLKCMNKWSSNETRETNFDGIFCIKWCSHIRNLNAFYIKNNDLIYILLVTVKSCNSWDTPNICWLPLVDGGLPVPGDSGGRLSSLETHSAETSVATLKVYYILYTDIWKYLYLTLCLSLSLFIYIYIYTCVSPNLCEYI